MSGIATAVVAGAGLTYLGTRKAAGAAERAAQTEVEAQMAQLEYLKERERLPRAYSEQAMRQLAGLYGLPGLEPEPGEPAVPGREEFIAGLREDPFYGQLREVGEEAILRGRAATGGLRAGGTQAALAAQNQALLRSLYGERVAGIAGLAGLPTYAPQIGEAMGRIGETRAAGITAAGRAQQAGLQDIATLGLGGLGMAYKYGVI